MNAEFMLEHLSSMPTKRNPRATAAVEEQTLGALIVGIDTAYASRLGP